MKIGVIGSGDVGQVLGAGFAAEGHEVMLGSRDPRQDRMQVWVAKTGANASTGTFAETADFAQVAVIATAWSGTKSAIELAGPARLAGKVVIDATNPLDFTGGVPPKLAVGHTDSGGESVQRWLPESRVVKAFNIVGNPHMVHPSFPGGAADMCIGGNEPEA